MTPTPTTSANVRRPLRAATGALTTTIAVSIPVFLVGGLAVQISDELRFSPAGLGLAVSAYFGASAFASVPAGALVERYGSTRISRAAIVLAAASLIGIAVGARSLWTLVAILAFGAAATFDPAETNRREGVRLRQGLSWLCTAVASFSSSSFSTSPDRA
jgi:MFS family permease